MLRFQRATSSALAGCPSSGVKTGPAAAAPDWNTANSATSNAHRSSRVHVRDLAILVHLPRDDCVVMKIAVPAALGDQRGSLGLHISAVVAGAALQDRRRTGPGPSGPEARERQRQYRFLQLSRRPVRTAVGRHFDRPDAAPAGPGQPPDLVDALAVEALARRGRCDQR